MQLVKNKGNKALKDLIIAKIYELKTQGHTQEEILAIISSEEVSSYLTLQSKIGIVE